MIALTNGARLVVDETPEQIVQHVREWRAGVIARAADPNVMKTVVALPIT